jgi:uncharacterized membrane protein
VLTWTVEDFSAQLLSQALFPVRVRFLTQYYRLALSSLTALADWLFSKPILTNGQIAIFFLEPFFDQNSRV